ncbi:MAG: PH domain-containing protein [Porcipelethomonas sp.]
MENETKMTDCREHPLKIIKYAAKNIWLLIFPLIRGIRSMRLDFNALYSWIRGAWFDILIVLLILGFGYLSWRFTSFDITDQQIVRKSGIIIKHRVSVPFKNISAVTAEHSFYLRPFYAVRLNIDTRAGAFSASDMSLLIRRRDLRSINRKMPRSEHHAGKKSLVIQPKWFAIVFFSLVFSSSLSGTVYIAAFLFQSGRFARTLIEKEMGDVLKLANSVSAKLAMGIPPAAVLLGIIIIATWLFSFISNMFRYAGFSMKKDSNALRVKMGVGTKRQYHIILSKINHVDLRQNLIMKFFKTFSVNISCSGYGDEKNELPVLLPILNRRQANRALDLIGFRKYAVKRKIKVSRQAVVSYLGYPSLVIFLIPIVSDIIVHFFPSLDGFFFFVKIMGEIPVLWMFIVKTIALMSSGITIEDDFCCIRYSRFYAFHTILADRENLVKIQIIQDPIAKKIGRCRMDFYFSSESVRCNKLKGVKYSDAKKIMDHFGFSYK